MEAVDLRFQVDMADGRPLVIELLAGGMGQSWKLHRDDKMNATVGGERIREHLPAERVPAFRAWLVDLAGVEVTEVSGYVLTALQRTMEYSLPGGDEGVDEALELLALARRRLFAAKVAQNALRYFPPEPSPS